MNHSHAPIISVFSIFVFASTAIIAALALTYPLLGTLGPESGLLFGLFIGPLMYFSGAIRGAYRDQRGFSHDLIHELSIAFIALTGFCTVLSINTMFVSSCAPARGLLAFTIHAVPVVIFDLLCGLLLGRLIGKRFVAFLASLILFILYIVFRCLAWWQLPSFRFISHPLVAVDGDLWGGAGLSSDIVGFRTATLIFAFALILLGFSSFSDSQRTHIFKKSPFKSGTLLAAIVLLLLGGLTHFTVVDRLEPSRDDRLAQLSREGRRGQFVVHSDPRRTTLQEAESILAEAHLWSSRLRRRMGEVSASDIHIWLYPDSESLQYFTGATHVHFALPKHREIHLTGNAIPHPTLGHEIAHVLVGEKTSTLLGVPGALGILANQGLTEGLAVMLTPELSIKNELTLAEQAAALAQSGKLPDLNGLFSISPFSFFAHNSSMSYSVAGAYLGELIERKASGESQKSALIERLASEGQVDTLFASAQDRAQFDKEFIARMKETALPKDAVPSVSAIFAQPTILSSTCEEQKPPSEDLVRDPIILAKRYARRVKQLSLNEQQQIQRLRESAGDLFWQAGNREEAAQFWRQIQSDLLPPSEQRAIQAKVFFAATPDHPLSRRSLDYLVYASSQDMKGIAAAMSLARELERNAEPIAAYLVLRPKVVGTGDVQDIATLEAITAENRLPQSIQIESERLIAKANALSTRAHIASSQFKQIALLHTRAAIKLEMLDYAERAELIAAALPLSPLDLKKNDIWLLGINRFDQ